MGDCLRPWGSDLQQAVQTSTQREQEQQVPSCSSCCCQLCVSVGGAGLAALAKHARQAPHLVPCNGSWSSTCRKPRETSGARSRACQLRRAGITQVNAQFGGGVDGGTRALPCESGDGTSEKTALLFLDDKQGGPAWTHLLTARSSRACPGTA